MHHYLHGSKAREGSPSRHTPSLPFSQHHRQRKRNHTPLHSSVSAPATYALSRSSPCGSRSQLPLPRETSRLGFRARPALARQPVWAPSPRAARSQSADAHYSWVHISAATKTNSMRSLRRIVQGATDAHTPRASHPSLFCAGCALPAREVVAERTKPHGGRLLFKVRMVSGSSPRPAQRKEASPGQKSAERM